MFQHNLTAFRGDTIPFLLTMQTDEAGRSWTSWGDYSLHCTIKDDPEAPDSAAKVRLSSSAPGEMTLLIGKAYWELQLTDSDAGARYFYDIQLVNHAIGRVVTLVAGTINVRRDITQTA